MSDTLVLPQPTQSISSLYRSPVPSRRIVCLHNEPQIADDEFDRVDESPFPIEPGCAEPPMPGDMAPEQFDVAVVVYEGDSPVPEEPEALVIGPHIAETVYEYLQRESVMCVW